MIVVRNVFRLKFGRSKEAVGLWKEGLALGKKLGFPSKSNRVLTDLVGPFYTVVFENTFETLSDFENAGRNHIRESLAPNRVLKRDARLHLRVVRQRANLDRR